MKKEIKLTFMEQKYFNLLADNPDGVNRDTLVLFHMDPESNVVDVHIGNLRRKLKGMYVIESQRGFGYKMTANADL